MESSTEVPHIKLKYLSLIFLKWLLLSMGADEFKNYNLIQYDAVNKYHI